MRVIVAGNRDVSDYQVVQEAMRRSHIMVTELITPGTRGSCTLAERWAREHNIPIKQVAADWKQGRAAEPQRNQQMAAQADALVALWDGKAWDVRNVIETALQHGLRVYIHHVLPAPEAGWLPGLTMSIPAPRVRALMA